MLFFRPKWVAKNIIVALDFDGCIALQEKVKKIWAQSLYGIRINKYQTSKETFPLGKEKYEDMMIRVTQEGMMDYELAPFAREVLIGLYEQKFRFAIVTSRREGIEKMKRADLKGWSLKN